MDQHLNFVVSLRDNASRQAKQLARNLGAFNNANYRTSIRLSLIDNVTSRLKAIRDMFSNLLASIATFPSKAKIALKNFGGTISSIFKSDGSKQWFEKIVGYFKSGIKWATRFGDALVGAFAGGGAAITAGIGVVSAILSKQLVKINSEMEQFEVSLQTTLGSLTAAKQEMAGIVQFAKETPYEIKNITDAVVKLRAYSMDSGKWLEPLGNAASAFGRDITDAVEMAADAVQGMFRRALSYGIKMDRQDFDRGGKYAGKTYAEALMGELEKRFEGGMELQAKTLKGIWSNIKDSLYISFAEATKPFYSVIKQQVSSLYDYLGSSEGQAKIKDLVTVMVDMLQRMLEGAKKVYVFIKTTLVPIAQTTGKAMLEVFAAVSDMVTPILTAIKPIAIAFASILNILSWLVTQSKLALQIFVAFSAAVKVMNLLGFSVKKVATNMVATGKAATVLSASIKTLGAGLIAGAASFAAMWAIGNYLEIKNNLKEIGNEIYNMAKGADQVKDKLKEIGEETGHTVKEMSKAAIAAKQFGHNMANVIDAASKATSESQEGFGKNLSVDVDQAAEAIGRLAAAFIKENDTFEEMERKTKAAADMLVNLNRVADITGFTFDDMTTAIEDNRDTLAEYADNIGELTFLIAEFGKAAKQAGIDANVGQFLDVLGSLLHPTKEMLLSLPSSTWIAKPLKDMDIDSIAKSLSESLDTSDIKSALVRAENTSTVLISASQEIRDNIEAGADYAYDKAKETAALYSATGGGTGSAPGASLDVVGRGKNFFGTGPGLAVAGVVGTIIGGISIVIYKKMMKKIDAAIGTNRLGLGTLARNMSERKLAKELGKDFLPRLEKAQAIDTKNMIKDYKAIYKDLEKELAKTQKALDKLQLGLLKNPALRSARPMGMSANDYVQGFIGNEPEELRKLTAKKLEDFLKGEAALEEKLAAIREKIAEKQLKEVENLNKLAKSYDDLREAFKAGKVPENMRAFAQHVLEIGNAAKTAAKELAKSGTPSKFGKGIMASILGALDFDKTFGNMAKPFKDGFSFRNTGTGAYGYQRFVNNTASTGSEKAVTNRVKSLTIGKYLTGPLFGKIKGLFGGGGRGLFEPEALSRFTKSLENFSDDLGLTKHYRAYESRAISKVWNTYLKKQQDILYDAFNSKGPLAKYSSFMPPEIQAQLEKYGFTLTKDLETLFDTLKKEGIKYTKSNEWIYTPETKRIGVPFTKKGGLGSIEGLAAYFHELGHAVDGLTYKFKKLSMTSDFERLLEEKVANEYSIKMLKEGNVFEKISKQVIKSVKMSTESYVTGRLAGFSDTFKELLYKTLPNDARGRFAPGNKYAWTTETAPRITLAPEVKAERARIAAIESSIDEFVKADKAASNLAKSFSKLNKGIGIATVITIGNAISEGLEPYLAKKAAKGESTNMYALQQTWKKMFGGPVGEIAEVAMNVGFIAQAAASSAAAVFAGGGSMAAGTLAGVGAGSTTGLAMIISGLAVENAVEQISDAFDDGARNYISETSSFWQDLGYNTDKALTGFLTKVGSFFTNPMGMGKSPEVNYVSEAWGEQYQNREKFIERDYDIDSKYGDKKKALADREAAYQKLMDERILENTQRLATKREEILAVLKDRIMQQFKALTEAGKGSTKDLQNELVRASKYVENNVHFGTVFDDTTFSDFVKNFEDTGTFAGNALAAAIDEALSNYDFSSSEGFKKFLQDMESENLPQAFKEFFAGMSGGDMAMTLSIEALKSLTKESDMFGLAITAMDDKIERVTTSIEEMEEELNRLEVAMGSISAAFELGIARNELRLTSNEVYNLEDKISDLDRQIAKASKEMTPLEDALSGLQNELQAVQDEITKTEAALDRLMNGPVEGETEYNLEVFDIEEQIRKKQYELDKLQREKSQWPTELLDSDLAKMYFAEEENIQAAIDLLNQRLDDVRNDRADYMSDVTRKRMEYETPNEVSKNEILNNIDLLTIQLASENLLKESLEGQVKAAQDALDAQADVIKNLETAKQLEQDKLDLIIAQVDEANKLYKRQEEQMKAAGRIKELEGQLLEIKELGTANALLQLAASGMANEEQLKALSDKYVELSEQAGRTTGEKTIAELSLPAFAKKREELQEKQDELAIKMTTLVDAINQMIKDVNIAALSKSDLESLFGNKVGLVINHMAQSLAIMASRETPVPTNEMAAAIASAVNNSNNVSPQVIQGAAKGGVAWQKQLTWVAEEVPEAIIPLQNGSVPVTLLGGKQSSSQPIVVNNTFGDITIPVRNDNDLEEIKKAIIDLRTGDTTFFASPHQYV